MFFHVCYLRHLSLSLHLTQVQLIVTCGLSADLVDSSVKSYNVFSGTLNPTQSISQPGNTENLPELEIPPENNANLTESNWFS